MSEITLANMIEMAYSIFFLFRTFLSPDWIQDSFLWRQDTVIILTLGIILITIVSFATIKLIITLKKRQRNFKELVNALEEDGTELDYNLKPLFSNESPPIHTEVSLDTQILEANNSGSENRFDDSQQINRTATTTANKSFRQDGNQVLFLSLNDLNTKKHKNTNEENKVFDLSHTNLKVDKVSQNTHERNIIQLNKADVVEDSINNDPARRNQGINCNARITNEIGEEISSHSFNADVETVTSELCAMEAETENNDSSLSIDQIDLKDETVDTEAPPNSETSIWEEIESVISGFDTIESESGVESITALSDKIDEPVQTDYVEESINPDPVMSEVQAVISEFDGLEAGVEGETNSPSFHQDEEDFAEESAFMRLDFDETNSESYEPLDIPEESDNDQSPESVEEVIGETALITEPFQATGERQDQPQPEASRIRIIESEFTSTDVDNGPNAPEQVIIKIDESDAPQFNLTDPKMTNQFEEEAIPVDSQIESHNSIENNITEPESSNLEEKSAKQNISSELAQRIIARLEFFQENYLMAMDTNK